MSYPSINRVVVIGRLTRDPELRALPSGAGVCALRIACNSSRRDPAGGYSERPNYFDVSVFGAPARASPATRTRAAASRSTGAWSGASGRATEQRRQAVSIVADTVQFLDGPGGHDDGEATGEDASAEELAGVAGDGELNF